jgi:hypothetical protein
MRYLVRYTSTPCHPASPVRLLTKVPLSVRFLMVSVCLYLTAIFLGGRTLVALQGLVRVGDETLMFLGNFLGEHGRFLVRVLSKIHYNPPQACSPRTLTDRPSS